MSPASFGPVKQIEAGVLNTGYVEAGPADGPAVILLHGWPYDIHSFADATPTLAAAGYRVIAPFIRGYGTTRFLSDGTPRAAVLISKQFTDYTPADYAAVVGVNLTGFFWLTQRSIAEMASRYGGHVVNLSATLAEVADSEAPAVLVALTKGALAAATRSLAVEYASFGIRVNAVSPGIIQTPVHPPGSYDGLGGRRPPLGRAGQISDVVDGILFLESSPYVTGEILHVDGGQIAGH